jgi:hypothetical protein
MLFIGLKNSSFAVGVPQNVNTGVTCRNMLKIPLLFLAVILSRPVSGAGDSALPPGTYGYFLHVSTSSIDQDTRVSTVDIFVTYRDGDGALVRKLVVENVSLLRTFSPDYKKADRSFRRFPSVSLAVTKSQAKRLDGAFKRLAAQFSVKPHDAKNHDTNTFNPMVVPKRAAD